MTDRNKLKDRARDELFSHINRCGVLQAAEEDQKVWMDETMEYLGERYPDLGESDLRDLYTLGMRFCRPAIPHGRPGSSSDEAPGEGEGAAPEAEADDSQGETVGAGAGEASPV
jgi:hypothetical protein